MILDEMTKQCSTDISVISEENIVSDGDNFDLDNINYLNSIDHAIADLESILADLKSIRKAKNIHGNIRYSIKANIGSGSYKRNTRGKVML